MFNFGGKWMSSLNYYLNDSASSSQYCDSVESDRLYYLPACVTMGKLLQLPVP